MSGCANHRMRKVDNAYILEYGGRLYNIESLCVCDTCGNASASLRENDGTWLLLVPDTAA